MKKISILSLHLGYGGIERCVTSLANSLCSKYEVEIAVCYKLYDKSSFPIDKRVKVKYLNGNLKPNRKEFMTAFKEKHFIKAFNEGVYSLKVLNSRRRTMIDYITNSKYDIIISTRDIFNYWVGAFARSDALKIGWEHNHFHGNKKYANNIVNSVKGLDYLVVVSRELEKYYAPRVSRFNCKCVYIPNYIEKMPDDVSNLTGKRIISVGRLSPEKGFIDLLKIFKGVSLKNPLWHLDIIGDGKEKEKLDAYIKSNNLEDKVTLHGYRSEEYIAKMLDKSSLYVMTSFTESFGIVLIEAMSHGLPCLAFSSAEGAREIIDSGENGYLINNRNFKIMEGKINDLIRKPLVRKRLGNNARVSVLKFTRDYVIKDWLKILGDVDE